MFRNCSHLFFISIMRRVTSCWWEPLAGAKVGARCPRGVQCWSRVRGLFIVRHHDRAGGGSRTVEAEHGVGVD